MAGAVMAATSDYNMYGDMSHNQCQYNSAGINSSWGVMPTKSFQACHEKARNSMAQSANARKSMIENYYIEMGCSSSSSTVEAAQLELADVLRGILEEQEADLANHDTDYNLSDYSLSSLIKTTTSPANPQGNQPVISVNTGHGADSCGLLINPVVLDVETLHHATSKYDIAAIGAESLLAIANPFNLDAPDDHQALSPASAQCDYSRLTCINSTICSSNDYLPCKSSSSNILQGYSDNHLHQQLEPIDMDASCRIEAHDSFDDYSLSTINGGSAVLGCNELLASEMGPSSLEVLNADGVGEAVEIIDDDDDNNSCDENKTVIAVDMTTDDGRGENVCIQEDSHMVPHQLGSNIEGDINNCVRDCAAGIAACTPEYGMVSICNEGALYPSGGQMKLMQREAAYAAAAMQPVDWAGIMAVGVGARPKRRNVRISQDPQTVSARRRRERISDRIRVLQRMVPGGTKLDTASMLDEAIHYLKYLKSQVQALEWLERSSSTSAASNLSLASSQPPYCLYPNFSTNYIQHSPSSRLMIIK